MRRRGLTLIEVLASAALLTLIAVGVAAWLQSAMRLSLDADRSPRWRNAPSRHAA
jgi:prepilin-type N-terminal cleavage/methylation domain-containing protein